MLKHFVVTTKGCYCTKEDNKDNHLVPPSQKSQHPLESAASGYHYRPKLPSPPKVNDFSAQRRNSKPILNLPNL